MRSTFFVTFFMLMSLFSGVSLDAQVSVSTMDIDRCIEIALQNNIDLNIQRDKISEFIAKSEQLEKSQLPQISLDANYIRFSDVMETDIASRLTGLPLQIPPMVLRFGDEDNYALRGTLTQPLFLGYRLKHSIESTRKQISAEESSYHAEINSLIFRVKEAYYNLLYAMQSSKLIRLSLESVDQHLKDVNHLLEQGMVTRNELLKVEIKKSELELYVIRSENTITLRRQILCDLMGIPIDSELTITDEVQAGDIDIPVDSAFTLAREQRPEINRLNHQIDALNHQMQAQRGDYFPSLSLIGSYEYGKPGLNKLENEWMDYWTIGIASNWKLWDWGIRGTKVQEVKARLNYAEHSLLKLNHGIALDVQQAKLKLDELKNQLSLFKQKREQAEESFRLVQNEFRQGLATNSDFLDSENQMTKSKIEEYNSIINYNIALANYERAIGLYAGYSNK
ncbi:TolC family protein [candidate division KSB1 bacterium]|nr:TolC family protein [candidate division KSB1 bacterium]